MGTVTNGVRLNRISPFSANIGGSVLRLTKSPLKALLVVFWGKGRALQFIGVPLFIRTFPIHQALNRTPFLTVPVFLILPDHSLHPLRN